MQPIEKLFCVQIVSLEDSKVEWTSEEMAYSRAEKVEAGAYRNLNHDKYYSRIQPADEVADEDY